MEVEQVKFLLWAEDMSRAVRFWTGTFGFAERFVDPHWSELDLGGPSLALHGGHDGSVRSSGLSIQVRDIAAAVRAIEAAGGVIVQPPMERPNEPIRLAEARDTEGNQFMVTQYVGVNP